MQVQFFRSRSDSLRDLTEKGAINKLRIQGGQFFEK